MSTRTHTNPDGTTVQVPASASIGNDARIGNCAQVRGRNETAFVERVGTGSTVSLYRIEKGGVVGWEITAGCATFTAPTVAAVCDLVKANVKAGPPEWAERPAEDRERWAKQVRAALKFLAASVVEVAS